MDTEGSWGDGCRGCSSMLLRLQFAGLRMKLENPSTKNSTVVANDDTVRWVTMKNEDLHFYGNILLGTLCYNFNNQKVWIYLFMQLNGPFNIIFIVFRFRWVNIIVLELHPILMRYATGQSLEGGLWLYTLVYSSKWLAKNVNDLIS